MSIPRTRRSRTFFPLILAGSLAALPCRASAQEDDGTDSGADTAARFEALDANHDGWITKAEAAKDPSVAYDDLLRVGDANHDGRLSRGEFESANNEILANGPGFARGDDQPEALFVQWDENRDDRLGPSRPCSASSTRSAARMARSPSRSSWAATPRRGTPRRPPARVHPRAIDSPPKSTRASGNPRWPSCSLRRSGQRRDAVVTITRR
ncbi:MAG: EF-hand domain-containing protein [Deltaproteobacteria bacterium]|nr:EF-hand domain-containing protein [Deltaproteobacteria bacterium]